MSHSKNYLKYVKQLESGCFTHFSEDNFESIIATMLEEADLEWAERALAIGLKMYPDSDLLKKMRIVILLERNELQAAELMLEDYLNDGTIQTVEICFLLAVRRGQHREACDLYVQAVRDGKLTPEEACERLAETGKFLPDEVLREALLRLVGLYPRDIDCLRIVGGIMNDRGDSDLALSILNRALDIDAYDIESWEEVARANYMLDRLDDCISACGYGLAIEQNNSKLHYLRGCILYSKSQWREALEDLDIQLKISLGQIESSIPSRLSPKTEEEQLDSVLNMMACCYDQLGETDRAIEFWTMLCDRDPKNASHHFELAVRLLERGNSPEALRECEAAIEADPNHLDALRLRVSLLLETGHNMGDIVHALYDILEVHPEEQQAWLSLGEMFRQMDQLKDADYCYRRLRDLKPTNSRYRALMEAYFDSIGEPISPEEKSDDKEDKEDKEN